MKHHIAVKFIAIFLCAAAVLGAAGSAVGIFAMAELGLYERGIDEAYGEHTENYAGMLANEIAIRHASMTLGGCNAQMADALYGSFWSNSAFDMSYVGYKLKDADGEVLQSQELYEAYEPRYQFTFPAGGRYTRVLSTMTEEEKNALEAVTEPPAYGWSGDAYVSVVPEGEMDVYGITLQYSDGSSEGTDHKDMPIGYLSQREDGGYLFQSYEDMEWLNRVLYEVVSITFRSEHGFTVYEASGERSVVENLTYKDGLLRIELPGQTEGMGQEDGVIYDAIPAGGTAAATVSVTYGDGSSESAGGFPSIGFLSYDENSNVVFRAYDSGVLDFGSEPVVHILFLDEGNEPIYEARCAEGVGFFYSDPEGRLTFCVDFQTEDTAPEDEVSGETYIYDDVPPQGYAVHTAALWLKGGTEMYTVEQSEDSPLGIADHDANGNVTFTAGNWRDFTFSKPAEVVYLQLRDSDGRILYESRTAGAVPGAGEVIGIFAYDEAGQLVFTAAAEGAAAGGNLSGAPEIRAATEEDSADAAQETGARSTDPTMADETVPETTAEATVPETAEETIPTAAEQTVPVETAAQVPSEPAATTVLEAEAEPTEAVLPETAAEGIRYFGYYDYELDEHMVVEYTYEPMPEYTVEMAFAPGALTEDYAWQLLGIAYSYRDLLLPVLGVCLLVFAVMAVYLCCAAGRKPGRAEVRAGGMNCIPLDLYLGAGCLGEAGLFWAGAMIVPYLMRKDFTVALAFAVLLAFAICLLPVAFCFACAAQFKTPGGYWWRNSLCGRCLRLLGGCWNWLLRACIWLGERYDQKLEPLLIRFFKGLWKLVRFFWGLVVKGFLLLGRLILRCCEWLGDRFVKFFSMLPVTWQWLLVGFVLVLWLFIAVDGRYEGLLVAWVCGALAAAVYGAHCFGVLLDSTKRMSKGDLDEKVDDKLLIGSFRDFAHELNGLADVAVVAAQKQLKSERMKTELITNVSHDIKTPLTSIINYVDLLQKPHTDEEQEMYLEVLERQSQRLKKLIEDLMEMSKASTGNLTVDIQKVNAAEAINQALGEFADKLEKAQLIPVFRQPDTPIEMMADGRLVWRVMSNLLGNAVKYALPGTRVYLDLIAVDGKVIISMKNISREELNVHADELLERFVRGDASRNTEGSGLGLNIAQSLMELQKGQLQLLVDGDLFKVTLIFPGV